MGCYDTVMVPCPDCGVKEEFQTKSGDCCLWVYEIEDAPEDVLAGVNRHAPYACQKCGTLFYVKMLAVPAHWRDRNSVKRREDDDES